MPKRVVTQEDVEGKPQVIGEDVDTKDWEALESQILKLVDGQRLVGVLTRIEENVASPILHFKTSSGEVRMWASAKLEEIFNDTYIGHTFEVVSLGKVPLKGGRKMNAFSVRMKPDSNLEPPTPNTEEQLEIIRAARDERKKDKDGKKKKATKKGGKKKK